VKPPKTLKEFSVLRVARLSDGSHALVVRGKLGRPFQVPLWDVKAHRAEADTVPMAHATHLGFSLAVRMAEWIRQAMDDAYVTSDHRKAGKALTEELDLITRGVVAK